MIVVARKTTLTVVMLTLLFSGLVGTLSAHADAESPWVSKAPMREARTSVGVAVVNGKIYAIGGAGKNGFTVTNEEYDPAVNKWIFKTPMPTPRSNFGIAVYENKIYCMGGYTNCTVGYTATEANEVYNPATDKWKTKAPMPVGSEIVRASVVNGKIYVVAGVPVSNGTFCVYDLASDTWTTKASIPIVDYYASAAVDDKIYLMTSKLTQIYDTKKDTWTNGVAPPLNALLASAGVTTGVNAPQRIYLFGADAEKPFWQVTLQGFTTQSYDPQTGNWTVCASMPTGRFDVGIAVVDDNVYAIGGHTIEIPTDKPTMNPTIIYRIENEQYTPTLDVLSSPQNKLTANTNQIESQPFPITLVEAASASSAVFALGLMFHFKKRRKNLRQFN
jgi:N-acetylneuraminic acid mutarotase